MELTCPNGVEGAQATGRLHVAHHTYHYDRRRLDDGHLVKDGGPTLCVWTAQWTAAARQTKQKQKLTASAVSFLWILEPGFSTSRTMCVMPAL